MVKIVFGMMGSSAGAGSSRMATVEQVQEVLSACKRWGANEIDTARAYNKGRSEELLGEAKASNDFQISTKVPGFTPGSLTPEKIATSCKASLAALRQDKIDILYFHGPDRETPLEAQCEAFNALYEEGKYERFGMCNISAEEVQQIYQICKDNKYIMPTVYQGGFNPLTRGAEEGLFPTLRKLSIAFYAFSPLAGGFFSKSVEELNNPAKGSRMDAMKHFKDMYVNETSLGLLDDLAKTSRRHRISVSEAVLRWSLHHSALGEEDAIILGASSIEQAEQNLGACQNGALPSDLVEIIDSMWLKFKAVYPAVTRYHV